MKKLIWLLFGLVIVFYACKPDKTTAFIESPNGCKAFQTSLTGIAYEPEPFDVNANPPRGFPAMEIPADNPMTVQGIRLGRFLFYDKRLSVNNTISCGSCHQLQKAFTDGTAHSPGAFGQTTPRSSPSLINIGYASNVSREFNFMWDGMFATLEQQHLAPIENPIEMAANWGDVECVLRNDTMYHRMFRQAFGIDNSLEITKDLAAKAIAQFVRTLNSAESRFDKFLHPRTGEFEELDASETRGYTIFFNNTANFGSTDITLPDGECGHCHNTHQLTNNGFFNNGLEIAPTLNDFPDRGLGAVTGIPADNGKFRAVSLRNIALTAPYMHDGRFTTLNDVMAHYVQAHARYSPNLDNNIANPTSPNSRTLKDLTLSEQQDIVNFLMTLTDTTYFSREEWSDPF